MKRFLGTLAISILLAIPLLGQQINIPAPTPTGYVADVVDVIPAEVEAQLVESLRRFELDTSIEIALLVVNSTEGEYIRDFALRHARDWGVGKSSSDTGILFVAAISDRKWSFEVGYGMEPFITDLRSKRIAEKFLVPLFKQEKYAEGLVALVGGIQEELGRMSMEDRQELQRKEAEERMIKAKTFMNALVWIIIWLLFIAATVYLVRHYLKYDALRKTINNLKEDVLKYTLDGSLQHYGQYSEVHEKLLRLKKECRENTEVSTNFFEKLERSLRSIRDDSRDLLLLRDGHNTAAAAIPKLQRTVLQQEKEINIALGEIPSEVPASFIPEYVQRESVFKTLLPEKAEPRELIDHYVYLKNLEYRLQAVLRSAKSAEERFNSYLNAANPARENVEACEYRDLQETMRRIPNTPRDYDIASQVLGIHDELLRRRRVIQMEEDAKEEKKRREKKKEEEKKRHRRESSSYSSSSSFSSSSRSSSRSSFGGGKFGGGGSSGGW